MINQFLILNTSGVPLYNWQKEKEETDFGLISGFLSAFHMFAKSERGEEIKRIHLDPTTFIFEEESDLIFVILTKEKKHEKFINLILKELKDRFLKQYQNEIEKYSGNMSLFRNFENDVEEILSLYGYYDYLKFNSVFDSDEEFKCFLFLEKTTGDILYIKSRGYIDRDDLSFQAMVLLKSVNRNISDIMNEESLMTLIVTEKNRCLLFKVTEKIIVFQERKHELLNQLNISMISPQKIKKLIKKPSNLTSNINEIFIFFNKSGIIQISNDILYQLKDDLIPPDCITLINTSKNVTEQIFKEKLFATFLFSNKFLYTAFPINGYFTFMQIASLETGGLGSILSKIYYSELSEEEQTQFTSIMKKVNDFRNFFV